VPTKIDRESTSSLFACAAASLAGSSRTKKEKKKHIKLYVSISS